MPAKKRAKRKNNKKKPSFFRSLLAKILLLGTLVFAAWLVTLDFKVRAKFNGDKWDIPARVYSHALELYEGLALAQTDLVREFNALGYDRVARVSRPGQFAANGSRVHFYTKGFDFWDQRQAPYQGVVQFQNNQIVALQAAGKVSARLEPVEIGSIYPQHGEDRVLVGLSEIPPLLGESLIAVEDKNFAYHHGFSIKGIARAFLTNLQAGEVVQGGSTLTQQLVKNFYLTHERSLWRKFQEVFMALLLEFHYSKADILEAYINEVYLGQSGPRGIHGFGLAAKHYFNRPLIALEPSQIALLVGLVKGATYYNPWVHQERATERRNTVLSIMFDNDLLTKFEYQYARQQPLGVASHPAGSRGRYPAYLDLVKRQLLQDYNENDLQAEGLRIFTTFSPMSQRLVEQVLSQRLDQFDPAKRQQLQGAAIVTKVGTGEVLAVVGDRNTGFSGFNRALDAKRQIGSLVKPFVYLSALETHQYTLISPIDDSPLSLTLENGDIWSPKNFSRESHGLPWLLHALNFSYNQSTARLGLDVGVPAVLNTLQKAGLSERPQPLPSVLLGALSLSPLEVSELYHTLAADGVYTPLRSIDSVLDSNGNALKRYPLKSEARFDVQASHLIHYALQSTMRIGTGRSAYNSLPNNLMLAGKTGTTNNQRDSWFAGYSGEHLGVVWIGHDKNQPTQLTGSSGALKVWTDIFKQLPTRSLAQDTPENIEYFWIHETSGLQTNENCNNAVLVPFVTGTAPREVTHCGSGTSLRRWFNQIF